MTTDSRQPVGEHRPVRIAHTFALPWPPQADHMTREAWERWVFERVKDVEVHEAGEFFRVKGELPFDPHRNLP